MAQWLAQLAHLPTVLLTASLGLVMLFDGIPLVGMLIPADAAIMVAVAARDPLSSGPVFLGVVGGYVVTASVGFFIGRRYGARVRASHFGRWIGEPRWTTGERMLSLRGERMLVAAPFLPVVNTLVPLVAGGLKMPYRRFLSAVATGSTLWTGLYVVLGLLAGVLSHTLPGGSATTLISVSIGLLLSWGLFRSAKRRLAAVAVLGYQPGLTR
jgi:membrane protein DedA with SNARE-associated domain